MSFEGHRFSGILDSRKALIALNRTVDSRKLSWDTGCIVQQLQEW